MLAALLTAAVEEDVVNHLEFPPVVYGGITLACLLALLAATYAFRSVGTRH